MKVIIINGPNLNLLGKREKSIYGDISFEEYFSQLVEEFSDLELEYFQSNVEGELIDKLQEVGFSYDYIILNAGGYTHTSVALADCIKAIDTPVTEVHISNIYAREDFRKKSLLSENCKAVICGLGLDSYKAGLTIL
ncbi:MAG: type II 3-dehydroquinate dehydratase [Flavobacteriales bacterium]|jgi:3-dehydroquinate dehydratase-2|nr:type II 3-dehydroquinate dehydratase [Flavobacteriales bacterium]MDP7430123.1 type II 3-dehydroquinate dehydratase [Flavobacteriales bacterium]HJN63525.1 type II 3-dehydroquinate dehydratase [Flavobacteriales bacterium]|tara:strand:- start:3380 stop:3790 length:411 start_codon:yes stop_codon:yes gene_type:complete